MSNEEWALERIEARLQSIEELLRQLLAGVDTFLYANQTSDLQDLPLDDQWKADSDPVSYDQSSHDGDFGTGAK